jgi:RNA polymerase sigma-70 factor (ECF subfamily)
MIKDEKEAEDAVQDVFLSLWGSHETLELRSSLASYLYSAVRYKFFDLLSKKKIRSDYAKSLQVLMAQASYSTDDYINEKELVFQVEKELTNLPAKMRQVFELSRKTGMSHRLIAEELSLSEKTVRNHVNHALKILRLKLGSVI